jgi:precorrin-6A/cobalt-precorrin-6A reductase
VILLLGGTGDARGLAADLRHVGYDVLVSTVSEYGARLAAMGGTEVRSGALDDDELERLVTEADAVVDATHPFAAQISAAAEAACARTGRPYLRVARPAGELGADVVRAADAAEAARLAVAASLHAADEGTGACAPSAESGAVILLTVGSKTVDVYAHAAREAGVRVVARVLPVPESLEACVAAGLEPRDVIAMQGPTTAELDAALLRHLGASVLVTKASGAAGGLGEKLRAAELAGAVAVVVERPGARTAGLPDDGASDDGASDGAASDDDAPEDGRALEASGAAGVLAWLSGDVGVRPERDAGPVAPAASHVRRGLLQVYTGDGKGKTTAAAGLALRARGAGLSVVFVQFVKGGKESSELTPLRASGVRVERPAVARSGLLRGEVTPEDRAAAAAAWAAARAALDDASCDLVVLDELHAALRHGLVDADEVLAALEARPTHQEVVTTGRGAPQALLDAAGLVTEMTAVRHPYPATPARRGIEL